MNTPMGQNGPTIDDPSQTGQVAALSQALKMRLMKKANNRRITDTNTADDMKSMDTQDDTANQ